MVNEIGVGRLVVVNVAGVGRLVVVNIAGVGERVVVNDAGVGRFVVVDDAGVGRLVVVNDAGASKHVVVDELVVVSVVGRLLDALRPGRSKDSSKEELMEIPPMGLGLFFRIPNTISSFFSKEENLSSTLLMILSSIPSSFSTLRCSCLNTSKSHGFLVALELGAAAMASAFSSLEAKYNFK